MRIIGFIFFVALVLVVLMVIRRKRRPVAPAVVDPNLGYYPNKPPTVYWAGPNGSTGYNNSGSPLITTGLATPVAPTPVHEDHTLRDIAIGAAAGIALDEGVRAVEQDWSDTSSNNDTSPFSGTDNSDPFGSAGGDIDSSFSSGSSGSSDTGSYDSGSGGFDGGGSSDSSNW